jgi:pectate lyase
MKTLFSISLLCVLPQIQFTAHAVPAFPGAEGYGAVTRGAYVSPAPVIKFVDNLNDSGPGSFRDALANDYGKARVIIFRVGGTINLGSDLKVRPTGSAKTGRVTIAGQTAPGGGICLKGGGLQVWTDDVIVRGLRIRPGDGLTGQPKDNRDCLTIFKDGTNPPAKRVIIDHCSLSWSTDEILSTWGNGVSDVSLQWCIFAEALSNAGHPKGNHSMGVLIGYNTQNVSIHHNLFTQNVYRNPLLQDETTTEVVNNVIRHGSYPTCFWVNEQAPFVPLKSHVIRNYYRAASASGHINLGVHGTVWAPPAGSQIYCQGNIGAVRTNDSLDEWVGVAGPPGHNITQYRSNTPVLPLLAAYPVIQDATAEAGYSRVLEGAGATVPARDAADSRVVQDIINSPMTGTIIDSQDQVGGWPVLAAGTYPADADQDGMPDSWEAANGTNPSVFDPHGDIDGNGYANLEDYLNSFYPVSQSLTIVADQDTCAQGGNPTANYGTASLLGVKDSGGTLYDRISYIRFPLSAISGSATAATLKIKVTAAGTEGPGPKSIEVRQTADDLWSETTMTWNTRPASTGTLMTVIDAATVGQVYSIDVTDFVNQESAGDGFASFILMQPASVNRYVAFGSREDAANQPVLEIE